MKANQSLRHFLTSIYGYTFFNALMWLSPVYAVFMQSRGVSDFGISVLLMMWSGAIIVTQFPLTWFARRCGAKNILMFGQIIKIIAFAIWVIWPTFAGFAIGMILWGMHGAIYDTVSEDILYDELGARTQTGIYAKILGRRRNYASAAKALSAAGSLLLFFGYEIITAATIVCLCVSMLFVLRMQLMNDYGNCTRRVGADNDTTNISPIHHVRAAIAAFRRTPILIVLMALCVMVTNFSYLNDYLSLIGVDIGLQPEFIGAVPFFILCAQVVGQSVAHRFYNVRGAILYPMIIVSGALFIFFALHYSIWALAAIGVAYTLCAIVRIVIYARFQDNTPTPNRMEVLSFYSITDQATYMMVSLIIGLGSMMGGWRYSIGILGILLCLVGVWATAFVRRRQHNKITAPIPAASPVTARPDGYDLI